MADLKTLLLNQDTQGAEVFDSPKERLNFYRCRRFWPAALAATCLLSRF